MSIFDTVGRLIADYELWVKWRPMVDELEAVLKKHGIDLAPALAKIPLEADPLVIDIQADLNELGAHPPLAVDGVMGPQTLQAILSHIKESKT